MRVLIDTTYARRAPLSGTAVYLERLVAALHELPDVEVLTTANATRPAAGGPPRASLANLFNDLRFAERELPRRARRARAEIIHHPLPAIAHGTPIRQVVTVHDLAFERHPDLFAVAFRRYAHLAHRDAARRARAVICVSRATAHDVRELWRIPPERIVVAHHGPGQDLPVTPRADDPRHLLYVGDDEPRKDLPTLLRAYRRYRNAHDGPLPLILAGRVAVDPQPGVTVVAAPDPDRLAQLLAGAAALVHPAIHEGFGLTLVEAMRAGTPIIAAVSPAAVEVTAEAALHVPPHDADALAQALTRVTMQPATRERLRALGRARAAAYSWNLAARAHRDAYSLALR